MKAQRKGRVVYALGGLLLAVAPGAHSGVLEGWISGNGAGPLRTETSISPSAGVAWQPRNPLPVVPAPVRPQPPATPLTLAELTDLALSHHPKARGAWAAAKAQAAALGEARAAFLPRLQGRLSVAGEGRNSDKTIQYGPSLSLSYVLFDFGARRGREDEARYNVLAASLSQNRILQEVTVAVERAYYAVTAATRLLDANRQSHSQAQASLQAARARREAGLATLGDVYRAEAALAEATLSLRQSEGLVATRFGELNVAAGFPVGTPLSLAPWPTRPPVAEVAQSVTRLLDQAKTRRPDLVRAQASVLAARAGQASVAAQGKPQVGLEASAAHTRTSEGGPADSRASLSVILQIPLFSGFAQTYAERAAGVRAEQAEAARDDLYAQVELETWRSYYALQTATSRLEAAEALLRSADQSREVAAARYRAGVGTILELITAQTTAAQARALIIEAQLDWYAALSTLNYAIGGLAGPSSTGQIL